MRPKIIRFPLLQEKKIACKLKRLLAASLTRTCVDSHAALPAICQLELEVLCGLSSVSGNLLDDHLNLRAADEGDQLPLLQPRRVHGDRSAVLDQSEVSIVTRSPPITAHLDPVLAALHQAGGVLARVLRHQELGCNITVS